MRLFFAIIVVAAIGYLGWVFYRESSGAQLSVLAGKEAPPLPITASTAQHPATPAPASARGQLAPPGVFYATERVVVQNATGVKALNPGEEVKLMYRYRNGSMLVTNGRDEFVVKPSSLTKDRPTAPRQP